MSTIFTIGHGNRTLDELVEALRAHDVTQLVDVRRFRGRGAIRSSSGKSSSEACRRAGSSTAG